MQNFTLSLVSALAVITSVSSCQSAYYSTMEKFGVHKRDILVERVEDGREAQQEAKEEIVSALEAFKSVVNFDGGSLEKTYAKLNDRYESSAEAVDEVKERISSIEKVSKALFAEWKDEIGQMKSAELKASSGEMLDDTQDRYRTLIGAMQAAESKMEPVLVAFRDHVLFLKHNLNANAIASLQSELRSIESNVGSLIAEMEKAIAEADAFIDSMSDDAN